MERLIEQIDFIGAEFVEQDGARIIKNASLLGQESRNGYSYATEGMRAAVQQGLYENVPVYLNHSTGARNVQDLAGQVRNARFEGMRIKGDIVTLPDANGSKIFDVAKHMPSCVGFSHVASGRLVTKDGKRIVESIEKVFSVDCVSNPATTRGIFEGETHDSAVPRPMPKETQYQFVSRCVTTMKTANSTISDEQATAACFASWQCRYEQNGMEPDRDIPSPAKKSETITGIEPEKVSSTTMKTENTRNTLDEVEQTLENVQRIANLAHPLAAEIARRESTDEADLAYQQRCAERRENARRFEEIQREIGDPGTFRESDRQFEERCSERRKLREQTERAAKQIAEQSLPPGGALIE